MLEVVDMSTDIHGDIIMALQDSVKSCLHVTTLGSILARIGIDRMMAHHDDPILLGCGKYGVKPSQLLLVILLYGIRIILRIVTILVHHRSRIHEHQPHGYSFTLKNLRVIARRHGPTTTHVGIVEYCLRIATILMVAQDREPVEHQLRMRINKFVVGHPQWVVDTLHTLEVMDVSQSSHTLYVNSLCHRSHQFGDRFLVVIAITPEVIGHIEVDSLLQLFPLCGCLREGGRHRQHANEK